MLGGTKEGPPANLQPFSLPPSRAATPRSKRLLLAHAHLVAAPTHLRAGVHDAPVVPSLAPGGRVADVPIVDLDLVPAFAALDHVDVLVVPVGEDEVVAALREDLVVLAVADALVDLVVVAGPVAGFDLAQDDLVCGESRGPYQGHHHHHQGQHHHQLAHVHLSSPVLGARSRTTSLPLSSIVSPVCRTLTRPVPTRNPLEAVYGARMDPIHRSAWRGYSANFCF